MIFGYGTITLFGIPFQGIFPNQILSKYSPSVSRRYPLTTPTSNKRCWQVWARSLFARHY